jgi:RNA polymerase sigma-70 factor (ECF subfamily)
MDNVTDEELVSRFRSDGGPPAGNRWIDALFTRYHTKVALWCYRFTGDRGMASDLAQEVFLRAWRNIGSFRGEAKFSTWLYTVARNHCVNEMKARSVRPQLTSEEVNLSLFESPDTETVLDSLEKQQSLDTVRALIARELNETERRVVVMHFVEEIGLEAINRLLGLDNPSGARAYILSAKRKLSSALDRWKIETKKRGS